MKEEVNNIIKSNSQQLYTVVDPLIKLILVESPPGFQKVVSADTTL